MTTIQHRFSALGVLFALCVGACSDDDASEAADAGKQTPDAGSKQDAGSEACVKSPKTHLEIINACTDAELADKKPELPLLLKDGGLPPLP